MEESKRRHRAGYVCTGRRSAGAFTLIELLVVVSIIALLVSILIPALSKAREQAKQVVCAANLRSVSMTYLMYGFDADDWLPWPTYSVNYPYRLHYPGRYDQRTGDLILFSGYWMVPYIEGNGEVFFCPSANYSVKGVPYTKQYLWPDRWPQDQAETAWKVMESNYLHAMYLSRNWGWSQAMRAPERISDPAQCLLGGDLTALSGDPDQSEDMINHRERFAVGDPSVIRGMNAMYIGGHVVWQTYLPNDVDKGERWFWLPEDIAPSIGKITKPTLEWPILD